MNIKLKIEMEETTNPSFYKKTIKLLREDLGEVKCGFCSYHQNPFKKKGYSENATVSSFKKYGTQKPYNKNKRRS